MDMTCEQFFDKHYDNDELYSWIDEMYWEDSFSSDKMFDAMQELAKKKNVKLTDAENWDYDKFFYNIWKTAEKGLS